MPKLKKNEHIPLNVTKKANHRIFCGLGWDPKEKAKFTEKLTSMVSGKQTHHDLDLSAIMYDADKNHINSICAKTDQSLKSIGQIYHSGDNIEGIGDGDDEQISVELKNLSPDIHHIIFQASIKSGHTFGEILSPEIRIVDGYSGHSFLHSHLNHKDGKDASSYIFCRIYRNNSENWSLHYIDQYIKPQKSIELTKVLEEFL